MGRQLFNSVVRRERDDWRLPQEPFPYESTRQPRQESVRMRDEICGALRVLQPRGISQQAIETQTNIGQPISVVAIASLDR
jgi:hypothetical protein